VGRGVTAIERTIPAQPKVSEGLKAAGPSPQMGNGAGTAGEVGGGHGTYEEDGPVTWEILSSPRENAASRSAAPEAPRVKAFWRCTRRPAKKKHLPRGRPKARGTGAEAEGCQEVGGPHMSDDGGEGRGKTTHPSKGAQW
jgi:hypothetical protein